MIRTIALRISGTEEAKNEIADMGEDIDDFVVRTKSKTDQIIKDYTAVAKNAYKGVSVLDDNGNLRDTYDILLDIAEIYEDIQKEDKQRGTNRAQALVETLAGKNRSNIVASILQNADILKQVHEASANEYMNSADQELAKYLDSIEGKVAQFKNRLQELASVSIDSQWIKDIVSFGTKALEVITALGKQFGTINVALGTFMGAFAQKKGFGLFNFDSETGKAGWGFPKKLLSSMTDFGKNMFTKTKWNTYLYDTETIGLMENAFSQMDPNDNYIEAIKKNEANNIYMPKAMYDITDGWDDATKSMTKVGAVMDTLQTKTIGLNTNFSSLGNTGKYLGNILLNAFSGLITSGIFTLISMGVAKLITSIMDSFHKSERIIDEGNAAREGIDEIRKQLKNNRDFEKDSAKRFSELRSGVSASTNKNLLLTNEEYAEYIELANQVADIYPSVVQSYDEQGNAILNLSTNTSTAVQELNNLLTTEEAIANLKIASNLQKEYDGVLEQIAKLDAQISSAQTERDEIAFAAASLNNNSSEEIYNQIQSSIAKATEEGVAASFETSIINTSEELYEHWKQVLSDFGVEAQSDTLLHALNSDGQFYTQLKLNADQLQSILNNGGFEKFSEQLADKGNFKDYSEYNQKLAEANFKLSSLVKERQSLFQQLIPDFIDSIDTNPNFNQLTEGIQSGIKNAINNIDPSKINLLPDQTIDEWLKEGFLYPISNVFNTADMSDVAKQASDSLTKIFDLNPDYMKASNYQSKLNGLLDNVKAFWTSDEAYGQEEGTKYFENFIKQFGLGFENSTGTIETQVQKVKKDIWSSLTKVEGGEATLFKDLENQFSLSQLFQIRDILKDKSFVGTLTDAINQIIGQVQAEVEKDGTLGSLFLDKGYQKDAEGYEKALSSLTSAMETLRSEGTLTAEAMRDIQEQFPTLTDFSFESISNEAEKQLGGWINRISEDWKDMSPEGIKQMQTYVTNLAASYGELDISAEEAKAAVKNSMVTATGMDPSSLGERADQLFNYEETINYLEDLYGEDINWQIVWTLAMEDRFSDPAANIQQEYDQHLIVWKLTIDTQKALAEIEKAKQVAESEESYQESRRQNKEAHGETLTSSDYTGSVNIANTKKNLAQQRVDVIKDEIDKLLANNATSQQLQQAYSDYMAAMTELNNADTELANTQKTRIEAAANVLKEQEADLETQIQSQELKISDAEANNVDPSIIDGYRSELSTLQDSLSSVQYQLYSKYLNDFAANNSEYADEFTKTANEYLSKSQSSSDAAKATRKAINDGKWARNEAVLNNLNTRTSDAENLMKQREEQGYKVEASYYEGAIKAATEERKELVRQQQEAQDELDKIRKDRESKGWDEDKIQADDDYQEAETRVKSFRSRFLELAQSITGWRKQLKSGIRLDELSTEFEQLEDKAEHFQKVINDEKRPANAADYVGAYLNAENEVANLQEQIVLKQQELSKVDFGTPKYNQIKDEVDSLKDSLDAVKDAQDGFVKSLFDMPINNVNSTIDQYKANLQALQDEQALNAKKGIRRTAEDIQKEINENQNILTAQRGLGLLYKAKDWGLGLLGYDKNSDERKQLAKEMQDNQSGITSLLGSIFDLNKEKMDLPITNLQKDIDSTTKSAERLKTAFDEISNSGREVTEADYKPLQDNIDNQIAQYEHLAELNADRMDDTDVRGTDLEMDYLNAQIDAEQQIASLKQQQHEYDLAIANLPVDKLQNQLDNMQQKEQEINDLISNKQAKGLKVNEREYKTLADLSRAQIKNLQDQNKEYDSQLKRASELKLSWQEQKDIRDKIAANKSTISGLEIDAIGFDEQAKNLLLTEAKELSSFISQALSETTTETGLAQETIDALATGFSDLGSKADISSIFYNTADGVKVDVVAMQRLAEQQKNLANTNLEQKMRQVREELERLKNAGDMSKNKSEISSLTEELVRLQQQQAEVFAQYEEMMKAMDQHSRISMADSTTNLGSNFDKAINYLKEAKDMWDKGLVGTDDFKERAKYFDPFGRYDPDTFKENYDKMSRYYKEGEEQAQGYVNFWEDLATKGLAIKGDNGIVSAFTDMEAAAQKMGFSLQGFEDILLKANDYGTDFILVRSMEDAALQTQAFERELVNAQMEYAKLQSQGKEQSVLDAKQAEIDDLKGKIGLVAEASSNFVISSNKDFANGIQNLDSYIKGMKDLYDQWEGNDAIQKAIYDTTKDEAAKYGVTIEPDFTFDESRLQEQISSMFRSGTLEDPLQLSDFGSYVQKYMPQLHDEIENIQNEISKIYDWDLGDKGTEIMTGAIDGVFGNINMNDRKIIEWSDALKETYKRELESWQYDPEIGSIDTVFGQSARFGEDLLTETQGVEVAFTPITQDGKLLSADTVSEYIETIIKDASVDGHLDISKMMRIDAKEGRWIGEQFVSNIIAGADTSLEYGGGNIAEVMGRLMHFSGDYGAIDLGFDELRKKAEEAGIPLNEINNLISELQTAGGTQQMTAFSSTLDKVRGSAEQLQPYLETLKGYSYEELQNILPSNGQYDVSEDLYAAEDAIQGIADTLGLTKEEGEMLVTTLAALGIIKFSVPTEEINQFDNAIKNTKQKVEELQESGEIQLSFNIVDNISGITDNGILSGQIEELEAIKVQFEPDSESYNTIVDMIESRQVQMKINMAIQSNGYSVDQLLDMLNSGDEEKINTVKTVLDIEGEEELEQAKENLEAMQSGTQEITIRIADDQMTTLTESQHSTTMDILGNNDQVKESIAEAKKEAEEANPVMHIFGNGSEAIMTGSQTKASIEVMNPILHIGGEASGVTSAINSALAGDHSITIRANVVGMPKYNGTLAMASGTAYNVLNYKSIGSYASGSKVSLSNDEDALVNEMAPNRPESIVRNGQWMLIPGGPHVEHLKKGDIIFNADQTEDLLKHGATNTSARAYAKGTVTARNGMSAFASIGGQSEGFKMKGGVANLTPSSSSTSTSDSLNEAAEKLSEATEEASDAAEEAGSALDGFKEWLGKLFDWIEVKLDSQEKKLDKIVSDAERALDNKNYDKAILKYNEAIEKSTNMITMNTQAASKYRAKAEEVLDKAIEAGAIDSNMAAEIKLKVESGDMNIEEYSDDIREVISAYQQWAEKVEQTEDKISDLQDKLNDYVDSLKEVADTQRDVAVSNADMYSDIGGGTYAFSGGAKYNQLRASDENIRLTNNAYAKNVNDVYNAMKTVRGGAINSIKANQDTNASYNEALGEARKNMNSGRKISDSVIQEVAKRNPSMAAQLQAYNRAWDNYQTANLEYVTKVTENSALKQQNTADKFDAIDSQLENEIKNLEQQNEDGDLAASEKNHNLDRIAQRQTKIASNATARADAYRREESTYRTQITQTKSAKGANYNGLTMKAKTNVNNVCQEALNAAKSGERIKDTTLTKLAQFVGSGLVTAAFYESCVNYNNAYEHRLEAEQAAEIAQVTRKKQAEEIALQKISNISEEAEKQRKSITISNNERRRQISARKAMGEDVEEDEIQLELDEQRQIYKNRKDEKRHILQQMKGMDENSDTYRQAAERLDEVREGASEAGNKIAELSGQMADLKLSGFDKAIEKLDKLKSKIQSVLDVNEAKGNYTDKTKLGQLAQLERDQAEQSRQKARKYESNANLAKKNGGTWAGHTTDYWEEQATTARTDQNQHTAAAYNYDKQIRELPFEKWNDLADLIDGDITALDNKAELAELKGMLVDVSVLEEKRAKILEKQNIHNKKIAELEKLIADPSIGEQARNEYKKQLQEEKNALDQTTQSLIQTNQSIAQLDIDKLNKAIESWKNFLGLIDSEMERTEAEGHYVSNTQLQNKLQGLQNEQGTQAELVATYKQNEQLALASPDGEYKGFSAAYWHEEVQKAETELNNLGTQIAQTIKQLNEYGSEQLGDAIGIMDATIDDWQQHLNTKELHGEYINEFDLTWLSQLFNERLNQEMRNYAMIEENLRRAEAEGKEKDAIDYQKQLLESGKKIEELRGKIFETQDRIEDKAIEGEDRILSSLEEMIDAFISAMKVKYGEEWEKDMDEKDRTTYKTALENQAAHQQKKSDIATTGAEKAYSEGRYKRGDELKSVANKATTSYNNTIYTINNFNKSNDSSSDEEEDTLADKLQRELNILDAEYNILKSKQELLQAQGEEIDTQGYQKRVDQLMAKIKKNEELVHANMQLANQSGSDDKKAKEYLQNAKQAEAEIYNLQVEMQNLGDEMRKTWLTKDLDEFIDKIGVLSDAIETITGLISDEMMYNEGKITDYGLTSLAMMIKGYEVNNKELAALLEKRAAYIKEYNEGQNPYYSKKEFIEDYKAITSEIQKATSTSYQMINKIVDATIKMREEEVKQIQSVIDKRKQLLQQQKDSWNWDRTLKQKNNDLSILEKQRAALQGLV